MNRMSMIRRFDRVYLRVQYEPWLIATPDSARNCKAVMVVPSKTLRSAEGKTQHPLLLFELPRKITRVAFASTLSQLGGGLLPASYTLLSTRVRSD